MLHRGRGRYVIVHADEEVDDGHKKVETFIVGHDVKKGESLQWIVPGGTNSEGLLISERLLSLGLRFGIMIFGRRHGAGADWGGEGG
jgi:hypothetical protein